MYRHIALWKKNNMIEQIKAMDLSPQQPNTDPPDEKISRRVFADITNTPRTSKTRGSRIQPPGSKFKTRHHKDVSPKEYHEAFEIACKAVSEGGMSYRKASKLIADQDSIFISREAIRSAVKSKRTSPGFMLGRERFVPIEVRWQGLHVTVVLRSGSGL